MTKEEARKIIIKEFRRVFTPDFLEIFDTYFEPSQGNQQINYTALTPINNPSFPDLLGSTPVNIPVVDIIDQMLHNYQFPLFTSFFIQGQNQLLEIGSTISGLNRNFIWATSNSSNVANNSIEIFNVNSNTSLASSLNNDGIEQITFPDINFNNIQTQTFRIQLTNNKIPNPSTAIANFSINFSPRIYWGWNPNPSLTISEILGLQSSILDNTFTGTYTAPPNSITNYLYFCKPSITGGFTQINDLTNAFNVTGDFTVLPSVIGNSALGVPLTYDIIRVTVPTAGGGGTIFQFN